MKLWPLCESYKCTFNPLPHMPILDSSNSATNKSMMSNEVQLSDSVENIVGKGEIACYIACNKQFLFPQCFQKLSVLDASK